MTKIERLYFQRYFQKNPYKNLLLPCVNRVLNNLNRVIRVRTISGVPSAFMFISLFLIYSLFLQLEKTCTDRSSTTIPCGVEARDHAYRLVTRAFIRLACI